MKELDRRTFLRLGASTAVGAVIGSVINPIDHGINKLVSDATGRSTGNAMTRQKREQGGISTFHKVWGVTISPLSEEFVFRYLPSILVSEWEGSYNPDRDAFLGTGGIGMSRRELIIGAITSIGFGAAHNFIESDNIIGTGFDRENLPASQTFAGAVSWYLQRKFGFFANTFAHAWSNFLLFFS